MPNTKQILAFAATECILGSHGHDNAALGKVPQHSYPLRVHTAYTATEHVPDRARAENDSSCVLILLVVC